MSRLTSITQSFDDDIAAELAAKRHTKEIVEAQREAYGSSRLPVEAGPFAMQDRRHPESRVIWADVSPGPWWEERCLHRAVAPSAYAFPHRPWPPKAQATLAPIVEQRARDFDKCIRNYTRSN